MLNVNFLSKFYTLDGGEVDKDRNMARNKTGRQKREENSHLNPPGIHEAGSQRLNQVKLNIKDNINILLDGSRPG